jgi:phage tail sheath protein FI
VIALIDGELVEVDGAGHYAAAMANVDPEVSPGGPDAGRKYLGSIRGTEFGYDRTTLDDLNGYGGSPIIYRQGQGAMIRKAVTTSTVSGRQFVTRRRMTDYIINSIADRMVEYLERPLDMVLASRTLGPVTTAQVGEITQFLADLKARNRIAAFAVDPFGGNQQSDLDAGRVYFDVRVKLYAPQTDIVLRVESGESVQILEAA